MLQNILTVSEQVFVMVVLVAIGFLCGKLKMLTDEASRGLSSILMYVIAPCILISSFQRPFNALMMHNFLLTFFIGFVISAASAVLTRFTIRAPEPARNKVLRSTIIFPNCGMISLVLQNSLYGADGVFYGAAYMGIFNLFFWTYGVLLLGRKEDIHFQNTVLNPGVLGTIVGLIFFVTSYTLPGPIAQVCTSISNINMPVAMLIIGQQMSNCRLGDLFSDRDAIWSVFQRLILIPLLVIGVFCFLDIDPVVAVACIISASAPAAACNTMLAITMKQDGSLSARIVSLGTALSAITMPVMVILAQTLL